MSSCELSLRFYGYRIIGEIFFQPGYQLCLWFQCWFPPRKKDNMLAPEDNPSLGLSRDTPLAPWAIILVTATWVTSNLFGYLSPAFRSLTTRSNNFSRLELPLCKVPSDDVLSVAKLTVDSFNFPSTPASLTAKFKFSNSLQFDELIFSATSRSHSIVNLTVKQ